MKKHSKKRQVVGIVVSNKMDKTIVVLVERLVKHRLYHKYIRKRAKYAAHDETNNCQVGDRVIITESKPLSKAKRWALSKIVERAV